MSAIERGRDVDGTVFDSLALVHPDGTTLLYNDLPRDHILDSEAIPNDSKDLHNRKRIVDIQSIRSM